MNVLNQIRTLVASNKKGFALLLDPDKLNSEESIKETLSLAKEQNVDFILVGGSLITGNAFDKTVAKIKKLCEIPLILFPGSPLQLNEHVDAVLLLSLISGRNPELLIGHHVVAAPRIKELGLETIATGYMLIDCGRPTTASYMSNTNPIPHNKPEIAATTALAGEMLGLQCIYLDGGSGAYVPISTSMIEAVKNQISVPLIVGGGLKSSFDIQQALNAGADIVVVGTAIEQNPELLASLNIDVSQS